MAESMKNRALDALASGYDRRDRGDLEGAERAFRLAAESAPADADAHGAHGESLMALDRFAEAVEALKAAESLESDRPHRLSALAEAEVAAGNLAAAAATCRRWTAIRPDSAPALLALGCALLALGDGAGAATALHEAVMLAPDDAGAAARLCRTLAALGQPLEALEAAQPALRRNPHHPPLHQALGLAWRALGEREKAAAAFRRCLELDAEDAEAAAALAGLDSRDDGGEPDAAYIRALFDRYAERFDVDLVEKLGYRAPALLRAALGDSAGELDILDLGCGTGLAGVAFAPLARHLAGVDLSPRMVDQARRRGLYQELYVEDLAVCLGRAAGRWDLILAADVFTYLGDLGPAIAAAAAALRPGGRLIASVETAPGLDGVEIMPSRRVRHGAAHVEACAQAAGLTLSRLTAETLRTEKRQPVRGLVFVMGK